MLEKRITRYFVNAKCPCISISLESCVQVVISFLQLTLEPTIEGEYYLVIRL